MAIICPFFTVLITIIHFSLNTHHPIWPQFHQTSKLVMKSMCLFSACSATFSLRIIFFSVLFWISFTLWNQYLRSELWLCSLTFNFSFVINSNSHIHVYNTFWSHLFRFFLLPLLQSSSHPVNNPHGFSIWFVGFFFICLFYY